MKTKARVVRQAGGVVIRRDGRRTRVLVVRSSDGLNWLFPKGHIEAGETAKEAALREVREEAGADGEVRRFLGHERYTQGRWRVEVAYYLVEYRHDVDRIEDRDLRWHTPAAARRALSFDSLKLVLDRAVHALA
jgi:8-oxo-dGTP pyrophosphatase MutT (NUDIX family)